MLLRILNLLASAQWCLAQPAVSLTEPTLGFLSSVDGSLRPIRGLANAATIGDPLDVGTDHANFDFSPSGDYLLATNRTTTSVLVRRNGTQMERILLITTHDTDDAAISPVGSQAFLYDRKNGRGTLFHGLPESRISGREVNFNRFLTTAAIDDQAATVVASSPDGESVSVLVWKADTIREAARLSDVSDIRFFAGAGDAVIAVSGTQQVYILSDSGRLRLLAAPLHRLQGKILAAPSLSGDYVYAVGSSSREVAFIDVSTGAVDYLACDCLTDRLVQLAGQSMFALNGGVSEPLWLLDGGKRQIRLIPAVAAPLGLPIRSDESTDFDASEIDLELPPSMVTGEYVRVAARLRNPAPRALHGLLRVRMEPFDGRLQFSSGGNEAAFEVAAGASELQFKGGNLYLRTALARGVLTVSAVQMKAGSEVATDLRSVGVTRQANALGLSVSVNRGPTAGADSAAYDLVYTGVTEAGPDALRIITFNLTARGGSEIEILCPSCQQGFTLDLTEIFRQFLGTSNSGMYKLTIPVTVKGSLYHLERAESVFREGQIAVTCSVTAPWGGVWECN